MKYIFDIKGGGGDTEGGGGSRFSKNSTQSLLY
jgi:hypothetical protein